MPRPPTPTWTNLFFLGSGEILTRGLTFLAFAWLGRVLEPAGFGLLGASFATLMVGTLMVDLGLPLLGSREIAVDRAITARFVPRVVGTQLVLAGGVYLLLLAVTWTVSMDPGFARLLRGLGLSLFGVPFLLYWVFQGRNEMFWYAVPTVLRYWVFLVVAVLMIRGPGDLHWLPAAEIAAVAAAGLCWAVAYRRHLGVGPFAGWPRLDRALLAQGLPIGLSNLIWALRMFVPVLVVLGTLGADAAGYFESGHRIFMVFSAVLGTYFTNVYPALSVHAHGSERAFLALMRRTALTAVAATLVLALAVTATGDLALTLVFGAKYATPEAGESFVLLAWLVMIFGVRRTCRNALIVLERQRLELCCSLVGIVLLLAAIVPMTRGFGIVGAAATMVATEGIATVLTALALWPHLRAMRARLEDGGA